MMMMMMNFCENFFCSHIVRACKNKLINMELVEGLNFAQGIVFILNFHIIFHPKISNAATLREVMQ